MLETSGYPWYLAAIMSIFIYAGALKYIGMSFLVSSTLMVEIAIMSFLVNFRHIVYGLLLFNRINRARRFKPRVPFRDFSSIARKFPLLPLAAKFIPKESLARRKNCVSCGKRSKLLSYTQILFQTVEKMIPICYNKEAHSTERTDKL